MSKLVFFRSTFRRAHTLPAARRSPKLICVWTRDQATGSLVCRWRPPVSDDSAALAACDHPPSCLAA